MAGRRDIEAGRASILLTLKNQLAKGLRTAQEQMKNFARNANQLGGGLLRIGAAITTPFLATLRHSEAVKEKLDGITKTLSGALEPAVLPLVDAFGKIVDRFSAWAKANPQVLQTILKIGAGLVVAGLAIKFMAAAASVLSVAFSAAGAILATFGAPLLLIGAAIAAAVAIWLLFTTSGQQASATMMNFLRGVGAGFNSLVGLIASGQMEAAWELVCARMQISWRGFQDSVRKGWMSLIPEGAPGGFLEAFRQALQGEVAEGKEEVERLQIRMKALMDAGSKWGIVDGGVAAQQGGGVGAAARGALSAASTGGALALGFGGGGNNVPLRTLDEIRAAKKILAETLRAQKEAFARKTRPGIFGP